MRIQSICQEIGGVLCLALIDQYNSALLIGVITTNTLILYNETARISEEYGVFFWSRSFTFLSFRLAVMVRNVFNFFLREFTKNYCGKPFNSCGMCENLLNLWKHIEKSTNFYGKVFKTVQKWKYFVLCGTFTFDSWPSTNVSKRNDEQCRAQRVYEDDVMRFSSRLESKSFHKFKKWRHNYFYRDHTGILISFCFSVYFSFVALPKICTNWSHCEMLGWSLEGTSRRHCRRDRPNQGK